MTQISKNAVDLVPFATREFWTDDQTYEVWWEDPRDIFQVTARFTGDTLPSGLTLEYWRYSWPKVRVPKGAVVGAGETGWLANDDWTSGEWQRADAILHQNDREWVISFQPLNASEFPQEQNFPAEFRRTLKLRLCFPEGGAQIEQIAAFSDSVWREEEIAVEWRAGGSSSENWNGCLEAFNGQVVAVRALDDRTRVEDDGTWKCLLEPGQVSGVVTRVRVATNEDRNSFDRTILTLRTPGVAKVLPGVSFLVDEALAEPVYICDLGVLARNAGQGPDFATLEREWEENHPANLYHQIDALSEQTWEQAWHGQPRKTNRMYFTLGGEGSRQKFGVEPDGTLFFWENYLRRAPGKDTPRLDIPGRQLRLCMGFPQSDPGERSLLEGYLPVIRAAWTDGDLVYEQEVYATWLAGTTIEKDLPGDDPMIAMLRVHFTNQGNALAAIRFPLQTLADGKMPERLAAEDGWVSTAEGSLRFYLNTNGEGALESAGEELAYMLELAPGANHAIFLHVPHLQKLYAAEREQLRGIDYNAERNRVADFWRQRIAQGAQIRTPNETINNYYRSHLMHMLVINDRDPAGATPGEERNVARCGGFHYGSYPNEGCMSIVDLDRRGYHKEAERCLELYVHYQGTVALPGNFKGKEGVFYGGGGYEVAGYNQNHGWVLWCLAEHYRFTRNREWLERIAPAILKACQWIVTEREATKRPGSISYGFLPAGSLEDVTDYWTWLSNNAFAYWGFRAAADMLLEIDHPEAERLDQEAQAFGKDVTAGFYEAAARSPVIRLRDGRWIPHFPSRQERRGRDFGWLREVLEGASHLVFTGIVPANSAAAGWIAEDYEDNLFLSDRYGYQPEDFDRQWFNWGGFSMQSNLLLFPPLYLGRDKPKHFLRAYFNAFVSAYFPDTVTMCEHALPDLSEWRGDHFKTSDEANSTGWLRQMFLFEQGSDLWVGKAIPRAWLAQGQILEVQHAATHFGPTSLRFVSETAAGSILIRIEPPQRNAPEHIYLRVRHPQEKRMHSVWINGLPHRDFDSAREVITISQYEPVLEVRVFYND